MSAAIDDSNEPGSDEGVDSEAPSRHRPNRTERAAMIQADAETIARFRSHNFEGAEWRRFQHDLLAYGLARVSALVASGTIFVRASALAERPIMSARDRGQDRDRAALVNGAVLRGFNIFFSRGILDGEWSPDGGVSLGTYFTNVCILGFIDRADGNEQEAPASKVDAADLALIVGAAVAGDRRAVERLLGYVRPLVVRYCRARIGRLEQSFASADDVASEVLLAILRALSTYRDQGRPFLAFVHDIAADKIADAQRAETTELFKVLPPEQREILILRAVVGLSAEETATAVGSTLRAVRVAQHRALSRLRASTTELATTQRGWFGDHDLDQRATDSVRRILSARQDLG